MFLPHLASRLYGVPLLLARAKLDIILGVMGSRIGWAESALESTAPAINAAAVRFAAESQASGSGIAVIAVHGSLVRRSLNLDAQSGFTSYGEIGAAVDAAAADPSIAGILLDMDSPGGEAGGLFELAQHIREVNAIKPVWAIACDSAYSAAYAIACAASRVLVTQTAGVGSIGVIAMHVDQSVRDAQEGLRFTPVTAGDFKNDLSAHEPLNPASRVRLQAEVDRLYALFVDHVSCMRGLAPKAVRATQAASYFGPEAVDAGLVDALVRSDQVVSEFAAYLSQHRPPGRASRLISQSVAVCKQTEAENAPESEPVPPDKPALPSLASKTALPVKTKELSMTQQTLSTPVEDPKPNPAQTASPNSAEAAGASDSASDSTPAHVGSEPVTTTEASGAFVSPSQSPSESPLPSQSQSASSARSDALAVAELCQLAGQSDRIVGFLTQGLTSTQVRQALLAQRAQSEEITSLIHPDAPSKLASTQSAVSSALMAAVKKLSGSA